MLKLTRKGYHGFVLPSLPVLCTNPALSSMG